MTRFFCPGRVELAGNHTDQQRGRVMAAAMDRGITAEAEPNDEGVIRVFCEGFDPIEVELSRLWPDEKEQGRPSALVRGIAGSLAEIIPELRGFDAYLFSSLPPRRGLAASATLTGAMGGGVYMDVLENKILPIDCDFDSLGLAMCLTDTGDNNRQAEAAYAQIAADMTAVAQQFGEPVLARVRGPVFEEQWPAHQTDRQWMRARHFFDETWRVSSMADALGLRDGQRYMELMNQSGRSSEKLLRNITAEGCGDGLARCLEASGNLLAGRGAWRVHSLGFAGFVLALMPEMHFELYQAGMDKLFGAGACQRIHVSPRGVCLAQEDKALFNGRGFPEEAAPLLG